MKHKAIHCLVIDPEFKALILPHEDDRLEESLLSFGCQEAIVVWGEIILDGHRRYELCRKHGIPFFVEERDFQCRAAAMAWICAGQLQSRALPGAGRKYLNGKRYMLELIAERMAAPWDGGPSETVVRRIADEIGVCPRTVWEYAAFARRIDRLRILDPGLAERVLTGRYMVAENRLDKLMSSRRTDAVFSENSSLPDVCREEGALSPRSVKDTPRYDPDAEMIGLVLTIPSWIGSIRRTMQRTDMGAISPQTRQELIKALRELNSLSEEMITAAEGEAHE